MDKQIEDRLDMSGRVVISGDLEIFTQSGESGFDGFILTDEKEECDLGDVIRSLFDEEGIDDIKFKDAIITIEYKSCVYTTV